MIMFNNIERRQTLMTPETAKKFLVDNGFAGQRRIDPKHVAHLASEMQKGEYLTGHFVYARTPDGKDHVMNGQHSAWSVVESGVTVNANVEGYACEAEADLWKLFAKFDRHKSRTTADIVRASRTSMDEEIRQIPQGAVSHIGLALAMLNLGGVPEFSSRGIQIERRVAAIGRHRDLTLFLAEFGSSKLCARLPVRMAMAATAQSALSRAHGFWEQVVSGKDLPTSVPGMMLRDELNRWGGRGSSSALSNRKLYALCILHYNAHVEKKPIAEHNFNGPLPKIAVSTAPLFTIYPPIPKPAPQANTPAMPPAIATQSAPVAVAQ